MALSAHTPPNPREGGRAFTAEELEARAAVFDIALAAQTLAHDYAACQYHYRELRAREVAVTCLEWLDSLDQLVGHPRVETLR